MNKKLCILDTDIGDDIDDAFALYFLLNEENAELLGVTTVFRNSLQRARMASYLIHAFQKDIKVYPGIDDPLRAKVEDLIPPEIKAKEKLDERGKYYLPQYLAEMDEAEVEEENAVDYLIREIRNHPHEITLFAIGPLTNVATAMKKAPDIIPLIKELRIMGGEPTRRFKEWNIFCDPEAAAIVYGSGVNLSAVGLNVTMACRLDVAYRNRLQAIHEEKYRLLSDMMQKWFAHYEFADPVMHDPLAVLSAFYPVLTFEKGKMEVGTKGELRAETYLVERGNEIAYATKVDTKTFFDVFLKVVFREKEAL